MTVPDHSRSRGPAGAAPAPAGVDRGRDARYTAVPGGSPARAAGHGPQHSGGATHIFEPRAALRRLVSPRRSPLHFARRRLLLSLALGLLGLGLAVQVIGHPGTAAIVAWDLFAIAELSMAWVAMATAHPERIRSLAQREDVGRAAITPLIVAGSLVSLLGVILARPGSPLAPTADQVGFHLAASLVAVLSAWCLIHTVYAFHYAHLYYQPGTELPGDPPQAGGLDFGAEEPPNYVDFAYFAFGIGMTFQVADVGTTGRRMRLTILVHSLISFAFTTVVIALTVNLFAR